ncbi:MAG TPA: phosphoribosyltransferase family protein [Myxococcota bacterium]|nr:phosphoribosyltransferase family protein [Myxococcota bacterium]
MLLRELLDFFLPPICGSCGAATSGAPLCPRCDEPPCDPLPAPPRPLIEWRAGVTYDGNAADWVQRFKYPQPGLRGLDPAADGVAIAWALRAARALGRAPDAVVPVALHARRLRERGFSPPAVLARAVAREVGARFAPALLERVRDTVSQTALNRAARRHNVAGAFRARGRAPAHVWLVDDVVTSGATLASAARALRRAGAREVRALAAAYRPLAR